MQRRTRRAMAALAALGTMTAGVVVGTTPTVTAGPPDFRLQLLHASDLEGGVDAIGRAPNFAAIIDALEDEEGVSVDGSLTVSAGDNVIPGPFFAAASDTSIQPTLNSVFNTFYGGLVAPNAYNDLRAAGGRIDYSIMNVIEFDASALGNHEFDLGSEVLATNIKSDLRGAAGPPADRWMGVQFPYLSANLNFSGDANLSNTFTTDLRTTDSFADAPATPTPPADGVIDRIAPNALYQDDSGELIGIVGATTPILQTISSPTGTTVIGPTTDDMPALAAVLQPAIDEVIAAGADKVILTSHLQQISLESQLATLLDGVDIIIAGGSDTILANPDDTLQPGATPAGAYPLVTQSSTGEPVAIVSTDGEYTYVGRLVVDFDAAGILVAPDGTPLDAVSDLDATLNGPIATTTANVDAVWGGPGAFDPGTKGQLVTQLVNSVTGVVTAKDSAVFGETEVFIDGRRSEVRTQETTAGNLSADANLYIARLVDPTVQVSIKNGGGIRAEIGEVVNDGSNTLLLPPQANPLSGKLEGQISQLDIENSLRFNNSLTVLTTTAAGLKELVEHAVAATAPGATPGQFPQIGGMAFSFDPTRQARTATVPGERVRTLVVGEGLTADPVVVDGQVTGDPTRPIRIVTLGFLADPNAPGSPNGGDNYPFPAVTVAGSRVNLSAANVPAGVATFAQPGTEQDAFAEFLAQFHGIGDGTPFDDADTPPSGDLRIQNLSAREDTVLDNLPSSSTTTLTASASSQIYGQTPTVTLTADVDASDGSTPEGQVRFVDGGGNVLATLALSGGSATYQLPTDQPVGTLSVTAEYLGSADVIGSVSSTVEVTVVPIPTTTELLAIPRSVKIGGLILLIAQVEADAGRVPAGRVEFRDGDRLLGSVTPFGGGIALWITRVDGPAGQRTLSATFVPSVTTHAPSSDTATVTVRRR